MQSALKVRDFVVNNVSLNNVDIKYLNYKLSTASEIWEANCGNKVEKAILLSSLLNDMGFKSNVAGLVYEPLHKDFRNYRKLGCSNYYRQPKLYIFCSW